ncbi:MAG: YdcF family protein [Gallionella sp.]|nr:YdcF family protein [Gallionella sp.]
MSWFITNLIAAALLPPLNLLLLMIVGLVVLKRRPKLGRGLLVSGIALLWLSATPYFAEGAMHWLEKDLKPVSNVSADAIVILGCGSYMQAPEYGGQDTVSDNTLLRVRYGAMLYRKTGKPILVTGGAPLGNAGSEGQQMKAVLEHEFQVPVRWTEDLSNNTLENALFSAKILQAAGIKRIYLVSHAWHLPRSIMVFRQAGFEVIPAPTAYTTRYETNLLTFLPNTDALHKSKIFTHEIIGLIWYHLKAWAT